ncbi:MAG: Hint domain-containing protein [Candidatus Micrarchaeaceae archaeon]
MANGKKVPIDAIKPGDIVLSYNVQTHSFFPNVITAVLKYNVSQLYVINYNVTTDANELFYTKNGWVAASNLRVGDTVLNPITNAYIEISSIAVVSRQGVVYDLIGASSNNFIADGYLSDQTTI